MAGARAVCQTTPTPTPTRTRTPSPTPIRTHTRAEEVVWGWDSDEGCYGAEAEQQAVQ